MPSEETHDSSRIRALEEQLAGLRAERDGDKLKYGVRWEKLPPPVYDFADREHAVPRTTSYFLGLATGGHNGWSYEIGNAIGAIATPNDVALIEAAIARRDDRGEATKARLRLDQLLARLAERTGMPVNPDVHPVPFRHWDEITEAMRWLRGNARSSGCGHIGPEATPPSVQQRLSEALRDTSWGADVRDRASRLLKAIESWGGPEDSGIKFDVRAGLVRQLAKHGLQVSVTIGSG